MKVREPSRRTQAERRASTRAALIAAGARRFAREGFAQTSLDAVAADAGLTKGAVYHQFPDKEALFLAIARERLAKRTSELPAAEAALASGGEATVGAMPLDPEWSLLFLEFVAYAARHPQLRAGLRDPLDQLRETAAERLTPYAPGRARLLADGIAMLANGAGVEALLDGDQERASTAFALMIDLMLAGLRAEEAG